LFIGPAAVLPGGTAAAQVCGPPSAEHAFEELLDVATDDSPVEEEAWRIADEQEARNAFESPDTIRRIDELARANGFVYDCASRMYHPVSGPDPRDAIENDEIPVETGTGSPDGSAPGAGAPDGISAGPETTAADGAAAPLGQGGEIVPGGGSAAPAVASSDPGRPGGEAQGSPAPTAGGRPVAGVTGDIPADDIPADDIVALENTDQSSGGVVALPGGAERESSDGWRLVSIVALIGAAVGLTGAARARRRRPELLN
jgi:hypothetical protein